MVLTDEEDAVGLNSQSLHQQLRKTTYTTIFRPSAFSQALPDVVQLEQDRDDGPCYE